jgi:hypothetical protein
MEEFPTRDWDPEQPFLTPYTCLWCSTAPFLKEQAPPELKDMTLYETYHKDHSIMCFNGAQRVWIFLYKKLPEPTTQRLTYSKEDMEKMINTFGDWSITETVTVREAYDKRMNASMASLEEGVINHWSWGRIVLAGDSCHNYAPNAGLGYQDGLQDVVTLCNRLHSAVAQAPGGTPSTLALTEAFQSYSAFRRGPVNFGASISESALRLTVWANFFYYLLSVYIIPFGLADYVLLNWIFPLTDRQTLVLDYVKSEEPLIGRVDWVHKIPTPSKAKED